MKHPPLNQRRLVSSALRILKQLGVAASIGLSIAFSRCLCLAGIIHEADSAFFSDCSDNSTGVRVRSFASYTLTWMWGYFFFSSKPTFNAAAELSYSDLNLPSTSRI